MSNKNNDKNFLPLTDSITNISTLHNMSDSKNVKKLRVHIDQYTDVNILAPVRKTVALTSMINKKQHLTRQEHLPLRSRA